MFFALKITGFIQYVSFWKFKSFFIICPFHCLWVIEMWGEATKRLHFLPRKKKKKCQAQAANCKLKANQQETGIQSKSHSSWWHANGGKFNQPFLTPSRQGNTNLKSCLASYIFSADLKFFTNTITSANVA